MKYDKKELEKLILDDNLSYEEIGRKYQCSGANIKKVSKRLGIKLIPRRKINEKETFNKGIVKKEIIKNFCLNCGEDISHKDKNIYCDVNCQKTYLSKIKYQYFLTSPQEYNRSNFSNKVVKRFILEEQGNKCDICGCDNMWNNKHLVFILDHIDGDASNNIRENLRGICPNCDSQLDTYKSKNKNSSRTSRYK